MQREGVFREIKRRRFYEEPSEKPTREQCEAIQQARAKERDLGLTKRNGTLNALR
jgi:small subunit ribosomal protein S21